MSKGITASEIMLFQQKTRCSDTELKNLFLDFSKSDKEIRKIIDERSRGGKK